MKNELQYVRILFKPHAGPARWYWAIRVRPGVYRRVKKDGDTVLKETATVVTEEILVGEPLKERAARMNVFYAELEIAP